MYIQAYSNNLASSTPYGVYERTLEVLASSIVMYYTCIMSNRIVILSIKSMQTGSCRQYYTMVQFANSVRVGNITYVKVNVVHKMQDAWHLSVHYA